MNDKQFYMAQPEWQKVLPALREFHVPPCANSNVQTIYFFTVESTRIVELPGIPDSCLDIVFYLDGPLTNSFVIPSPKERMLFTFAEVGRYVGIRLKPCHHVKQFALSQAELNDQMRWLVLESAPFLSLLWERLIGETMDAAIIAHILAEPIFQQAPLSPQQLLIEQMTSMIYTTNGNITLKQLEQQFCYSARYVRMLFQQHIGMSPKQFMQITQLQHLVNEMKHAPLKTKDILATYPYYDESHFYKMFKKYMNMTPQAYAMLI